MARFSFQDIRFRKHEGGADAYFLRIFRFRIPKERLDKIGSWKVEDGALDFPGQVVPEHKISSLISAGFNSLINTASGKRAVYVHKNSGIPLIGSNAFGIVDRGTNLIEVKPITGCNLRCIYCSVNDDRRVVDFVVEKDYLIEVFNRTAELKTYPVEAHIDSQGEPLYYADLAGLVRGLKANRKVKVISIDTNAMMLTRSMIDQLADAGLTRFNISIDSFEEDTAEHLAGCAYNLKHVKDMILYASSRADVMITPLIVFGINDHGIGRIIDFAKDHGLALGIQNYMSYKGGRNPGKKEIPMKKFFGWLKELEAKHGVRLIISADWFDIVKQKTFEKPFRKGEIVDAKVMCPGRLPGECIAVARDRSITVSNCSKNGRIKLRITRTKHNIFYGV